MVVEEMWELERNHGVRVFLFQDDDFPLWGKPGRRWVNELTERMHDSGLPERAIWKISCRAEYVEPELFAQLRDAGLFLVYMGIESGVERGLEVLHKQMTVAQNLAGVQILKDVGVLFSYGFMLFDPSSTFASVRENLKFLRQIVGDGSAAATFCRMLPYGGTPIRDQLAAEGRLLGDVTHPDYDFLDARLGVYYRKLHRAVQAWLDDGGLSHELNWAREELATAERLTAGLAGVASYRSALAELTAESNERLFRLVENSSLAFEQAGDGSLLDPASSMSACASLRERLLGLRNGWVADNRQTLLEELNAIKIRGPVGAPQVH